LIITNRINVEDCCPSTSQASPESLFRMGGYIGLCVSVIYSIYFSTFMTYLRDCNRSKTTGVISEAGTAYPSRAPEFTPFFVGFVLCFVDHCLSFFVWPLYCLSFDLRPLIIRFGIFKLLSI